MTNIEWTDKTWQVTHGCSKVAAGCANCYAIRDAHRMAGNPNPKISGPRQGLTKVWASGEVSATKHRRVIDWTGVVRTAPENLDKPLRWKKPQRIFVNSNSDLFHPDVPFEFIAAVYGVMAACPRHRFIILTKRPERMLEFYEWSVAPAQLGFRASDTWRAAAASHKVMMPGKLYAKILPADGWQNAAGEPADVLPNVITGASIANQPDADRIIPIILQVPSACRAISLEPMIGPVYLQQNWTSHVGTFEDVMADDYKARCPKLDWVIVGGESGPNARPCDVAWIRSIIQQCKAAAVPVFVKQLGSYDPLRGTAMGRKDKKGGDPSEWPEDIRVREMPNTLAKK